LPITLFAEAPGYWISTPESPLPAMTFRAAAIVLPTTFPVTPVVWFVRSLAKM